MPAIRGSVVWLALWLAWAITGCGGPSLSLDEIRSRQQAGRYAETIEPLRLHLDASPDDPEIHLLYGTALARTGGPRLARWSLKKAAETPEWEIPALFELAAIQLETQAFDEAIASAERILELDPENTDAHVVRGEARLGEGSKPELAIEDFDFVLEREPESVPALTAKASALLLARKIDEAAEVIDELESLADASTTDPDSRAQMCAAQSVLRYERGDRDGARKRFDECLEEFPAFGQLVDAAIGFFDVVGERERSDAILEKALELAPHSLSYRRTLALRKEAEGESERALAIFRAGLESEDREQKIAAYTDLTNYHLDRDELPQAVEAYEQALALVTERTEIAVLTLADLMARAGRHEDARRVAKELSNPAFVGLIEGRIALDEGDPQRALAALDRVFAVWPNNAGARYYAARAAEQLGNFPRAIEEYRQSIRSAADQTEAALRLAKLYLEIGSIEDAWANAGYYVEAHGDDPEAARVLIEIAAEDPRVKLESLLEKMRGSLLWPTAVALQAEQVAEKKGPAAALAWIEEIAKSTPDWKNPSNAVLLRRHAMLLDAAGRSKEADAEIRVALDARPKDSRFLEARAALLERRGADPAEVEAAFRAAVDRNGRNWIAIEGLARSREKAGDLPKAIEFFDASTHLHPESPVAARRAAELAEKAGASKEEIEKRWHAILKEHPWEPEAAYRVARMRLDRGVHDGTTLDYAERAVGFGQGKPAEALIVSVHEARGEKDRAQAIAKAFAEGKPLPPRGPAKARG